MKHISCLLMAMLIFLLPVLAAASSIPANPMAPPGIGIIVTPTLVPITTQAAPPTLIITPTLVPAASAKPTPTPTATPEPTPEPTAVPAVPPSRYEGYEDILTEDIVNQLDAEVQQYLKGSGKVIETIDGIRNILLVGVDARPGETKSRSDTMVILTLDGNKNEIRMTSLMRDMYVTIPGRSNNRINAAWVFGGPELLLAVIEENFGLKIEEYVAVDLRVLIDIIDELGGLTLNVESTKQLNAINGVIDAYNYQFREPENDGLLTKLGEQQMNGKQVQAYARYRKIDSDVYRTARQREVLTKLFDKLQGKSIFELTKIASKVMDRIDTNLSLSDIVALIPVAFGMKDAEFRQMTLPYDVSYQSKTISGMAVLVADMDACGRKLEAFVNGTD